MWSPALFKSAKYFKAFPDPFIPLPLPPRRASIHKLEIFFLQMTAMHRSNSKNRGKSALVLSLSFIFFFLPLSLSLSLDSVQRIPTSKILLTAGPGKKCTAEENGRDENGRKRRESLEGDSRSAVEIKNRTYGHQHISINEFSGYRVYFRSGPATGVAANYNRFQQNDLRVPRPELGIYCAE